MGCIHKPQSKQKYIDNEKNNQAKSTYVASFNQEQTKPVKKEFNKSIEQTQTHVASFNQEQTKRVKKEFNKSIEQTQANKKILNVTKKLQNQLNDKLPPDQNKIQQNNYVKIDQINISKKQKEIINEQIIPNIEQNKIIKQNLIDNPIENQIIKKSQNQYIKTTSQIVNYTQTKQQEAIIKYNFDEGNKRFGERDQFNKLSFSMDISKFGKKKDTFLSMTQNFKKIQKSNLNNTQKLKNSDNQSLDNHKMYSRIKEDQKKNNFINKLPVYKQSQIGQQIQHVKLQNMKQINQIPKQNMKSSKKGIKILNRERTKLSIKMHNSKVLNPDEENRQKILSQKQKIMKFLENYTSYLKDKNKRIFLLVQFFKIPYKQLAFHYLLQNIVNLKSQKEENIFLETRQNLEQIIKYFLKEYQTNLSDNKILFMNETKEDKQIDNIINCVFNIQNSALGIYDTKIEYWKNIIASIDEFFSRR